MNKLIRKPKSESGVRTSNIFERFNLKENPFPYNPFIEPISDDAKRNGTIFSREIRKRELEQFYDTFLTIPLNEDHDRIGYLLESSFTGRGNGKSAFLVHLAREINADYGLRTSNELNKTFAIYLKAKSGGENSKFWQVTKDILEDICNRGIIEDCLLVIRYKVLEQNGWLEKVEKELVAEEDFVKLNDNTWLTNRIDFPIFHAKFKGKLRDFGIDDLLLKEISYRSDQASSKIKIMLESKPDSWLKKEVNNILFDNLVRIFVLADFNGAYILIDEFEKIAEFQKPNERIEFAHELRQKILESSQESGLGDFFMYILTMHPGTQRLILEAWERSGINARSPLPSEDIVKQNHVILFDDIKKSDIKHLLAVYLSFYRIDESNSAKSEIYPFTMDAINLISELVKFNAAKILKFSHLLIRKLAKSDAEIIDQDFVTRFISSEKSNPIERIDSPDFLEQEVNAIADSLKGVKFKDEQ